MTTRFLSKSPPRAPIDNEYKSPMSTVSGELQVASRTDDISVNFQYGPSTFDTVTALVGAGAVGSYKAMAKVSIDTGVDSACLSSKESVRYRAGHESLGAMSHIFAEPQENVNQYMGFLDTEDGFALGYQGLQFGAWYIEGGNYNFIPQTQFNANRVDGLRLWGFDIDPQKLNVYKITYAWHGGLPAYFSVYGGHKVGWVLMHVVDEINTTVETHLENPSLPLAVKIERTSGTGAAGSMYSGSWRGGVVTGPGGEANLSTRMFHYAALEVATVGGQDTAILLIRSKLTFQGKTNHITQKPMIVSFVSSGAQDVVIRGVLNPTLAVAPVWADTDTDNSVSEWSPGPIQVTSSIPAHAPVTILAKSDSREVDAGRRRLSLFPGQTLAIVASSSANSSVSVSLSINELF